jgi:hypothetical protein
MKNRFITICIMAAIGVTALLSADVWQKKKYSEWNEKEVAKILSDSPWARKVSAKVPGDSGARGGAGGMDTGGGSSSEAGDVGGGGGGKRGGGKRGGDGPDIPPAPPGVPTIDIVVWWQSALPIKQAIARYRFKDEAGPSAEVAKILAREEEYHIVGVIGIPERIAGPKPEVLKSAAVLNVRNVPPIEPAGVHVENTSGKVDLFLFFPKHQPGAHAFKVEDDEVELVVKSPTIQFKQKFKLKDMVFDGKLEM